MSDKVPYHAYEKRGKMIKERDKRIAELEAKLNNANSRYRSAQTKVDRQEADNERLRQEMLDASTQTCSTIFGKPYSEWKELDADNERLHQSDLEKSESILRLMSQRKQLRAALELAMDELTGEAWLAADMALKGAEE